MINAVRLRTGLRSCTPLKSAMVKLKRLVRYLVGFPPGRVAYSRQAVYGDGDWAGNEDRKRSTTGVAEIFGGHPLDAASATQSLVALSSAEAESYTCATARGLQTCHFLTEAGYEVMPRVWSDSSACRGIVRQGTGLSGTWRFDTCGHRNDCRKGSSC